MIDITEASKPAKATRKLLEKDIQKQCVEWARARGYWARKFSSMTQISVPDYLFAKAPSKKFAVEFKAPSKTSTPAQRDEQMAMSKAGWCVFECDNFDKFKEAVLAYESLC
jgi:hypothetical protein